MNSVLKYIESGIVFRLRLLFDPFLIPLYRRTIDKKVRRLRKKDVIRVAFVVSELGVWKSESLFIEMLRHKRFSPVVLIIPSKEVPESADDVKAYCTQKDYEYVDMRFTSYGIKKMIHPDIILYQKPYDYTMPVKYGFRRNWDALFCFVSYGFHSVNLRAVQETPLINASWQVYYENEDVYQSAEETMKRPCRNGVVTGLPMSDDLMLPISEYKDPWKKMDDGIIRKRIIWGPHHSVGNAAHGGIDYSTFLDYSDFMLEMAKKYADQIQFAFKPHPLLKSNLRRYWSEEQIDAYYHQWSILPNTQIELGEYKGLFMYSDALIHDSGSFTIEYHYSHHPLMYLIKNGVCHDENLNDFGKKAFLLHEKGFSSKDIEEFIVNIIEGRNPREGERNHFFEKCLLPPHGKSASENIINAILYG